MFKKVLVANRGEIALRVIRSLQELGVESVAVASEADRDAPHALSADSCYVIGPPPATESYLSVDAILEAAKKSGAEAVHPGYGFLSENAGFAEACAQAGLVFIGPPPEAMRLMGSKTESRRAMEAAGVPVVPGFQGDGNDLGALQAAAESLGFPVLIKAASGGGGKGMRLVERGQDFMNAAALAQGEAKAAFGDATIYLERYLRRPRHIEIQVFGDAAGEVFYIGERECSIQRRHQKILEECPSPAVDKKLRETMGKTAVDAARTAGYRNAGTVEFLLDESGEFYFLEMNTRLQVEHPVTEMVYGVDLVAAQLFTAAGEPLPFDPTHLTPWGHAIEARVYAEDAAQGFLPQSGPVLRLHHPERPGVRVDSGLAQGRDITVFYDPLLAKVTAWGESRETATRRLLAALRDMTVLGVTTNIDFLIDVLSLPAWAAGDLHTGFLEENLASWTAPKTAPLAAVAAAVEAAAGAPLRHSPSAGGRAPSPWTSLGSWSPLGKS